MIASATSPLRVQVFQSTELHAQFLAELKNDVFKITQAS